MTHCPFYPLSGPLHGPLLLTGSLKSPPKYNLLFRSNSIPNSIPMSGTSTSNESVSVLEECTFFKFNTTLLKFNNFPKRRATRPLQAPRGVWPDRTRDARRSLQLVKTRAYNLIATTV